MMRKLLLSCWLLFAISGMAFAQSATFNKIWLEKDVTLNSKLGMKVHFAMQVNGLKGVPLRANVYFDEPQGVGIKDTDGKWCTTAGTVAIWSDFTPPYVHTTWNDYWMFVAYEDLHIKDYSKTYYCRVFIFGKQGGQYGHSEYAAFQVTKPATNNRANYSHLIPAAGSKPNGRTIYYRNSNNGIVDFRSFFYGNEWRSNVYFKDGGSTSGQSYVYKLVSSDHRQWCFKVCSPFSGYNPYEFIYVATDWSYIKIGNEVYNIPIDEATFKSLVPKVSGSFGGGINNNNNSGNNHYHDGPSHIDKNCSYCGGGGGCSSCNGKGYKFNPYSGHDDTCPSCNGSGRCFNCRGTGKQATY